MKTRILQSNWTRAKNPTKTARGVSPTIEEIRQRAQEISMARGDAPGNERDDWLRAEQQLTAERAAIATETNQ
jgi:hypothetical protein